jgi:hypothetical protein
MKQIIKNSFFAIAVIALVTSCTKYDTALDGAANTANAALSASALNNRIVSGFIVDGSTLPTLPTGALPPAYNVFRKLLTYDTVTTVNKPPAYKAGDVITIVGYFKGDDFAISKRRVNLSLYKAPAAFITAANPPSVINVMQNAEDRYRSYLPGTTTPVVAADTSFTLPTIATTTPTIALPFTINNVMNESIGGSNYNTYLIQFTFTVPLPTATKWIPGQVISINLNAGVAGGDLGNANWIYAFRIK